MNSKQGKPLQHHYTFNPKYQIGNPFQDPDQKKNFQSQKARDPSGNVRWKGAFTGGFEAGYKNTCGSKQGWTPSSFVSSRTNRFQDHQQINQKLLGYMDEQDLGGLDISTNIQVRPQFSHKNPLLNSISQPYGQILTNIRYNDSIGDKIIKQMKKNQAQILIPDNIQELDVLLKNYENEQILEDQKNIKKQSDFLNSLSHHNRASPYYSVGCISHPPQDQFITIYSQLLNKVIRKTTANQNEQENEEKEKQQKEKQQKQNRVYFDFTKPIDQQPQYLKEIKQIDEFQKQQARGKPRKRVKNVVNQARLKTLFTNPDKHKQFQHQINKQASFQNYALSIPDDYDPYYRVNKAKDKQKSFVISASQNVRESKHRIFSISQRSDIIGQSSSNKLSQKFVKPSQVTNSFSNKFVRAGQQSASLTNQSSLNKKQNSQIFADQKKNARFWDYFLEQEGKKISAQLQSLDFEEAERERKQFEEKYELIKKERKQNKQKTSKIQDKDKKFSKQIEQALKGKNHTVVRRSGVWKPQKVLCKRLGCFIPYLDQDQKNTKNKIPTNNLQNPYF